MLLLIVMTTCRLTKVALPSTNELAGSFTDIDTGRDAAVHTAGNWAANYFGRPADECFLAHYEREDSGSNLHIVAAPSSEEGPLPPEWTWTPLQDLKDDPRYDHCALAAARITPLQKPIKAALKLETTQPASGHHYGAGAKAPKKLEAQGPTQGKLRDFKEEVSSSHAAENDLKALIFELPDDDPDKSELVKWANIMQPLDPADIPA